MGQPSHCILRAVFGVRNTYDLFPEELQENVVTAVRQSLAMKAKQNPSQHFAHLCVNEEAIYNLEARPAQGVFFSQNLREVSHICRILLGGEGSSKTHFAFLGVGRKGRVGKCARFKVPQLRAKLNAAYQGHIIPTWRLIRDACQRFRVYFTLVAGFPLKEPTQQRHKADPTPILSSPYNFTPCPEDSALHVHTHGWELVCRPTRSLCETRLAA